MNKLSVDGFPKDGTMREQELFLLRFAMRAPSTHNSQPWKFALFDDRIEVHLDTERRLPKADPDGRDAFISVGACFENLVIAAKYFGMYEQCTVEPGFGSGLVGTVNVHPPKENDEALAPLMQAMSKRFNARGHFIDKKMPDNAEKEIFSTTLEDGISLVILDKEQKKVYAMLTGEGMRKVHADSTFRAELSLWMENNYSSRKDGIPGYSMLAPGPLSLVLPWMIRKFNLGGILAKLNNKSISSASFAAVLISREDSPAAWFAAGRSFERIALLLGTYDMHTSVYVASVEVPELREKLGALVNAHGYFPQFAFTFGYPKIILRQTPRYSPEERLIN